MMATSLEIESALQVINMWSEEKQNTLITQLLSSRTYYVLAAADGHNGVLGIFFSYEEAFEAARSGIVDGLKHKIAQLRENGQDATDYELDLAEYTNFELLPVSLEDLDTYPPSNNQGSNIGQAWRLLWDQALSILIKRSD